MRKAAFESLGPFLSTFYIPDKNVLEAIQAADLEADAADNSTEIASREGNEEIHQQVTEISNETNPVDPQEIHTETADTNNGRITIVQSGSFMNIQGTNNCVHNR